HPTHEKYTSDTFSVLIYQEQVMFLANKLAGIPNEEVNELRKGIGKKNQELIDKYESKFVEGCVSAGVDQEEAEHL
ncbi:MAG: hypothetical protein HRU20_14535, partial [Pseudomonadales bacterium]|nr:hypothetical protein [Pseudomonadales bacterium]